MKTTENDKQIAKTLGYLAMLYPSFKLEKPIIDAYLTILRDLPANQVQQAAEHLGTQARAFFPSAGEIRQAVFELHEAAEEIPSSYEAWGQVKGTVPGYHPLTKKALDSLGGQRAWGQSNIDDEMSWRARFISAYEVLLRRERDQQRMLPGVRDYVEQLKAGKVNDEITKLLTGMKPETGD
jgi:hypothetical protein